jgi:hypothetical protein
MIDHGYTGQTARPASMGDYLLEFSNGTPIYFATWNDPVRPRPELGVAWR